MSTVGRTKREQSISAAVQLHTQCIVISGTLKKIGRGNDKETAATQRRQAELGSRCRSSLTPALLPVSVAGRSFDQEKHPAPGFSSPAAAAYYQPPAAVAPCLPDPQGRKRTVGQVAIIGALPTHPPPGNQSPVKFVCFLQRAMDRQ